MFTSLKTYGGVIREIFLDKGLKEAVKAGGEVFTSSANSFFTSFAGSATLGIATFFAMKKALEALSDAYNLSYDSAMKNTQANVDSFNTTKTEIKNLESEAQQYKDTLSSLSDKYEVDLSGIESIDEMITKLRQSGKLELTDEAELAKIDSQNAALERQLAIKEKLLLSQQKQAASDARDALGRGEQSVAQQVAQFVPGGKKRYQGQVNNVGVVEAVNENVLAIQEYENAIEKAEKAMKDLDPDSKAWKEQEENINSYNEAIEKLTEDLNTKETDLTTLLSAFSVDGEGLVALDGFEKEFEAVKDAIENLNNINLSPAEQKLAKIESFFDGSSSKNAIKDRLLEIAKSGDSAQTVSGYLESIGVNLKNAGLDADSLNKYFAEMADSAGEAADATEKVNNNLTISDIETAFESENSGDDYVALADYIKQAKELYDQGLVGTDDFKSVAEMMSYNIDSSTKSFEKGYKKLKSYFKEDKDGNLTGQGVHNFLTDIQDLNKGYATFNKETGKWDINIENTAQAAKELGIGVGVFESILGRIKDYDNVGDFEFTSAVKEFAEAKTSLEGLKTTMEELEDGDRKNALEEKLAKWSPMIEKAEEDLASLPDEVVTELKFEYDLAEIQKLIDELNNKWEQGDRSAETGAARNVAKEQYREERERQNGYTEVNDENYASSYAKIDELSADFGKATTDKAREDLQEQISAIMEMQNAFQDALANGENVDWETFINSDHAKELMQDLVDTGEVTKSEIMDILGVDISMPVHFDFIGDATPEKIEAQMEDLDVGSTIEFTANLDGVEEQVKAIKNEDGTITYELVETGEELDLHKNGTVTYKNGGQEPPKPLPTVVNYLMGGQADPVPKDADVNYAWKSQDDPKDRTAYVTYRTRAGGGAGQLAGTAHIGGSLPTSYSRAYAVGTLQDDSWLKSHWKTKKGEYALTGEEGVEIVAHGNEWWTVGDRGAEFSYIPSDSVVFNAKQSKELLTRGWINGRGKSYLGGTAYLGSASGSFNFGGGRTSSSEASKKATTKTSSKTTKKATKALDAIAQWFDWIEVRLDRLARDSENAEKAIERAVGLGKTLTATNKAITAVNKEQKAAEKGATRYLKAAQTVAKNTGLSASLQKKVQNGTIDISKYSETTQKKIQEYQKWYEKYLDCLDQVTDLEDQAIELALSRFDKITEYYDAVNSVHESLIDANDAKLDYREAMGYSAVSDAQKKLLQSSIDEAKAIKDNAYTNYTKYQSEFNSLLKSGVLQKNSVEYYDRLSEINDLKAAYYEASTAVLEHADALREIEYTKLQNAIDGFSRAFEKIDLQLELAESRNEKVSESLYQEQIGFNNEEIIKQYELKVKKMAEQANYAFNSERYKELAEEIADIDGEINGLLISNEELKDSIFELRFDPLEESVESLKNVRSELEDFMDLINEETFFDSDTGSLTGEGVAQIYLLEQALISSKQEVAEYTEGLEKLRKNYESGIITEKEFNEKNAEYREGIRDAISDVKDYGDALSDLYITQMEKENELLQEIIDKRKEALQRKEDYYNYDKTLRNQTKDLNLLRAQAAALEGANDASSQAELKRLRQQIADAEEELNETKRQHSIEMQEVGYDSLSEDLSKTLEDTELAIRTNAKKQLEAIDSMLQQTVSKYSEAYSKINEIINRTGFIGSNEFNEALSKVETSNGSQSQKDKATISQSSTSASTPVQNIETSGISGIDTSEIEKSLQTKEQTKDRPVATITPSKTFVSVMEGKTVSVSYSVLPSDAGNKNVNWKSSDTNVATVSSGTIKGVKAGSCVITLIAADGKGAMAIVNVTVAPVPVVKPEISTSGNATTKPTTSKPTTSTTKNSSGDDGKIKKGEKVTFASGKYTAASDGSGKTGKSKLGKSVYIAKIKSNATRPYLLSTDKAGNHLLGWVKKSQLKGYASGSKYIPEDQFAWTQENGGSEIITLPDGSVLTKLPRGSGVVPSKLTENLFGLANSAEDIMANTVGNAMRYINNIVNNGGNNITYHYDSLLTVNGDVDKAVLPELQEILKQSYQYTTQQMTKDALRGGNKLRR